MFKWIDMANRICELFKIKYPVVQGGMIWCSGWELAAAVSNAGGLGLLGAGSMKPDLLKEHIDKVRQATDKPFGVNIPLISPYADELIQVVVKEKIPIVFTSAGSPKKYTQILHNSGAVVVHVVSSALFAEKSQNAGVDAVVAEGFEAGGHNGREETTTLTLVELVRKRISIPLIAAGGIATGKAILAVQSLGAEGVQIGSLFAACEESSADLMFKRKIVETLEGETVLTLKKLAPVRMIRNEFCNRVRELEEKGGTKEEFEELLGKGRAKKGMFEGDMTEGELEIGQSSALINKIESVANTFQNLMVDYNEARNKLDLFFND
jgi:enoyl-[acyl-carrier protein] reductase II